MDDSMEIVRSNLPSGKTNVNGRALDLDDSLLDNATMSIPVIVLKRINALKNIQLKMVQIETKFYEELHHLECKYAQFYEPLYEQREKIVNGEYEPTEEEGKWILDDENVTLDEKKPNDVNEVANDLKSKVNISEGQEAKNDENANVKGIPDFWLQTFKSTDLIADMIQEHDEPVLKHLKDIRVKMHDQKPYGYTLEFYFNDNEFFTNKILTKTYELTTEIDDKDPFGYDGPVLYKCKGCTIDWVKGKDVTVKLVKKKQKHKNSGTIRVITKEEKQDSFFNYFDTPTADGVKPSYKSSQASAGSGSEDKNKVAKTSETENDEENEDSLCEADFEIGHFFKEFLIPKAVLYFTGELTDEASYDEYDGEGDEDDDEEDDEHGNDDEEEEEEEEDEDENAKNKPKTKSKN